MAVPTRRAAFPCGRLICVRSPGRHFGHHPRILGSATVHGRSGASWRSDLRSKHCLVRHRPAHHRDRVRGPLDGVAGGFGVVAASGWGGPAECPVGELIDGPSGLLFQPVVMSALRAAITQAGPSARLVRHVVLVVTLGGGRRHTGLVQVACRTWDRCRSLTPGSWPRAWYRCWQWWVSRVSIATIRSGPPPGMRSRQVPYPPGGPSRPAGVKENPVSPGRPGPARFR